MPKSPPIFVTKTFVPPLEEYEAFISASFQKAHLTNQGPLVVELEKKLRAKLGVDNLQLVANGTVALQLALKALNIESGEVITTPFSYVATISSILWERCQPVFVDIEPDNFTLNPALLEKAITPRTRAIMPVHVFGYACNVEAIQKIAVRHGLKVIYDALMHLDAAIKIVRFWIGAMSQHAPSTQRSYSTRERAVLAWSRMPTRTKSWI